MSHSSHLSPSTPTILLAMELPNNDDDGGFGPKRKYSIDDKSYGGRSNGGGGNTFSDNDQWQAQTTIN